MEKQNNILEKYIRGSISEEEYNELQQQIQNDSDNSVGDMLNECWQKDLNIHVMPRAAKERTRRLVNEKIKKDMRRVWFKRASTIAASILVPVLIISTVYFYKEMDHYKQIPNIVSVNKGQRAGITLPDGTIVHLNSESKLTYTPDFNGKLREVVLEGEAFFEVTPNSEQPFIVDASGLSVKVLGTSFSVQTSDQGNEISVILVEGKVSLNNAHEKELVQLHPNQKADYFVNDEHYTVTEVDSERLTSWRKGIIFYDNASLDEIVRLIEQTYKVSLIYTRPENDDQRFSGAFLKTQKLETVLQQTNKLTGTNLILIQ